MSRPSLASDARDTATSPILVVDDDAVSRELVAVALRRAGYEVIEAASGEEALQIIDRQSVGVLVCDIGMPGMSGIDVIRDLRRRPETATLPIILVTGSGDDESVLQGLDAGADDFLSKPVRLAELVARVRAHLRTQAAWSNILQDELRVRSGVVAALGSLTLSAVPEETAKSVVTEICRRTDTAFVSVAQLSVNGRMQQYVEEAPGGAWFRFGLARLFHFGPIPPELAQKHEAVCRVDTAFIAATKVGTPYNKVFQAGLDQYKKEGFAKEWELHHQGGPTGYAGRDFFATADEKRVVLDKQAVAWNPSITGTKSEDTFIVDGATRHIVTACTADWPTIKVTAGGETLARPAILVR